MNTFAESARGGKRKLNKGLLLFSSFKKKVQEKMEKENVSGGFGVYAQVASYFKRKAEKAGASSPEQVYKQAESLLAAAKDLKAIVSSLRKK